MSVHHPFPHARHGLRRLLVALVTVVALPFLALPSSAQAVATPTTAAATQVKVLQLNICHSGINTGCFTGPDVITKAVQVIEDTQPQIVSVNEACSGDVGALRNAVGADTAYAFAPARRPNGDAVGCTNGQSYGNIILVAASLAGPGTSATGLHTAQDSGNERRSWACLPAGTVAACTTHLSANDGNVALEQCRELMTRAAGYAAKRPVVVSGDMNLRYLGWPNVQDCNRSGFYRKGDGSLQHVFASTDLSFVSTRVTSMSGTTDHPAFLVTTSL
ncbi:endonuclease/exonuclease/phosphatase family protein [Propionibacteriaceae bacterium Y1700]|uniref:endonuclease/exonuclease/phosphatase family protein n=1 Tax=Microlunatus sp. Y1700 TaxID=3418487 RepID=UPI003DA73173